MSRQSLKNGGLGILFVQENSVIHIIKQCRRYPLIMSRTESLHTMSSPVPDPYSCLDRVGMISVVVGPLGNIGLYNEEEGNRMNCPILRF